MDAIEFAQQMAGGCMRDTKLQERSCAALLWNILILLCRQNGVSGSRVVLHSMWRYHIAIKEVIVVIISDTVTTAL